MKFYTAVAARGYSRAGIDKDDIRFAFDDRTNWPPCRPAHRGQRILIMIKDAQLHFNLCLLKPPKDRESLEIFAPPPYLVGMITVLSPSFPCSSSAFAAAPHWSLSSSTCDIWCRRFSISDARFALFNIKRAGHRPSVVIAS